MIFSVKNVLLMTYLLQLSMVSIRPTRMIKKLTHIHINLAVQIITLLVLNKAILFAGHMTSVNQSALS